MSRVLMILRSRGGHTRLKYCSKIECGNYLPLTAVYQQLVQESIHSAVYGRPCTVPAL
jgi:hypothetical protein